MNENVTGMPPVYTPHKRVSLKANPSFSEAWLHDRICENTSMLGLGQLDVIGRERVQYSGGRLDMLLGDGENTRYEVEVLLGATDPSHIIRCIEYWDVERRRYPAYEHVAVLIAEEVTSRFLNVMSLLAGSIPLVAIQLNALQVDNRILLDFVKVLDQRALRVEDEAESGGEDVDRPSWEARVGVESLATCDRLLAIANSHGDGRFTLKYQRRHIAVTPEGAFFNVIAMNPRREFVRVVARLQNVEPWKERLEEAGIAASLIRSGIEMSFNLRPNDLEEHRELLSELLKDAVDQYQH